MSVFSLVLITYIVPVVLTIVSITASKNNSKSIYSFNMRPANAVAIIGMMIAGVFLMFSILAYKANQFTGITAAIFIFWAAIGVILMAAPIRGVWDTCVNDNEVTSSRFWMVRRKYSISDIDHCQYNQNGLVVYMKNNKKITINSMCTNLQTFEKRMEAEGIEVKMIQE